MKKLLLILLVFSVLKLNATDIYVNNSGQPGTYTTIQAAINAAAVNDRIFISPYGVYTENLTITKSLTITSAVANTRFSVVGNVTVTSAPNQDVVIIGGEFSGNITGNTGTATLANKGNFTISDCKFPGITNGDYILSKLLFCDVTNSSQLRHGLVMGSSLTSLTIPDGPNSNTGDTIKIIGNKFSYSGANAITCLEWNNNDNYFLIMNNYIANSTNKTLTIFNSAYNLNIENVIANNTLLGEVPNNSIGNAPVEIKVPANTNIGNIVFYNNIMNNSSGSNNVSCGASTCAVVIGNVRYFHNCFSYYTTNLYGTLVTGNIVYPGPPAQWTTVDDFGKPTNYLGVNQGSPALQFYDIDLTRNDMGTYGGPYSIDNYWNTATGRARVYDLNMPFEIWNGSTPSIKAEGIHIK
jgi:hypothetical protein